MFVKHTHPVLRPLYASTIGLPTPINLDYLFSYITLHNFGALLGLCLMILSYGWMLYVLIELWKNIIFDRPLEEIEWIIKDW